MDCSPGLFGSRALRNLLIAHAALFLLQLLTGGPDSPLLAWFALDPAGFRTGLLCQLLTYPFVTDGVIGFLFAMLWLWGWGRGVVQQIGWKHFLGLYAAASLAGGAAWLALSWTTPGRLVEPWPAVLALFAAWTAMWPRLTVQFILIPVEFQMRWLLVALASVIALLMLWTRSWSGGGAAARAGIATGVAYAKIIGAAIPPMFDLRISLPARARPTAPPFRSQRQQPKPVPPSDARVDAILDKISAHGFQSLTPEERKTLEKASKQM